MSEENVALVMESIRRFKPGNLDSWAELWHAETRLSLPEDWPEPGPFVGLPAVTAQFERILSVWSQLRFDDVEVVADANDWVVLTYRVPARGTTSELESDFQFAVAYRIHDSALAECVVRWRADEALEAAGLANTASRWLP
jgi:SnoaL-like domain